MRSEKVGLIFALICGVLAIVFFVLLSVVSATNRLDAAYQATKDQGWHSGPGDVSWIDMGDGTRCYQRGAVTFSCVRMQP